MSALVVVMIAVDIGVIAQRSGKQGLNRLVCKALNTAKEPDAPILERRLCAAANTPADQYVNAKIGQEAAQSAGP